MVFNPKQNQIRSVLFVWASITVAYFFLTWFLAQSIAHNTPERVLVALVTTTTYATLAVTLGRRILQQAETTYAQLEASLAKESESEERFRRLAEATLEGIVIHDQGKILEANRTFADLYGYSPDTLVGKSFFDLVAPQAPAHRAEQPYEVTATRQDGTLLFLEIVERPFVHHGITAHVASVRDITARKRTEQELERRVQELDALVAEIERAQTKARATLDAASDMMVLISPAQTILAVNQSFCDHFFGGNPREIVGRRIQDYAAEIERLFADPSLLQAMISDTVADHEKHFAHIVTQRAPHRREHQLAATPVHTRTGEYLGRLYVFHDVTREREVDRMKTEFVSLVSHELRTPLTSIKGYVDLLQTGEVGELTDEQREFLDIVKTNADRLVELINDLLDISRIEAGRVELKRKPLDLSKIISQVATTLKPQITAKQQTLALQIADALPPVLGDSDRLTQIVMNFMSNAYKYTPVQGRITIAAYPQAAHVRVDVHDTGIGLTEEDQAQLFTKFFRAKNRATQEVGGTGLGLALTRSLVEMHGGRVTVASAPHQGSTFSFTIPIAEQAVSIETAPPHIVPGKRIMVVDDEPDIAKLIKRYLERAGYTVVIAPDGRTALQFAQREHPDLITLDVMLPDTDGFTVLEWLKTNPSTHKIPVIMLSILADEEQGKLLGAVDYLTKPVNERLLLDHVARILANDKTHRVLVAEDDDDNRRLITNLLTRAGYQVLQATNGADAVQLAQEQQPGLVLLDIRMPEMDGITALQTLRADSATRDLPVIMMTGYPGALEENRSAMLNLGAPAILSKPFTAEQLARAIAQALTGGSKSP